MLDGEDCARVGWLAAEKAGCWSFDDCIGCTKNKRNTMVVIVF